jgi:hypothetical protein
MLLFLWVKSISLLAVGTTFDFESSVVQASDGYIRLSWISDSQNDEYELQKSTNPEFVDPISIYKGPDQASFISGLKTGDYYFRVRGKSEEWSPVLKVTVTHPSLKLALTLSAIGLSVFLITVLVIIRGAVNNTNH